MNNRRSEVCLYLASKPNQRCDAIAKALGKPAKLIATRLLKLEKAGRVKRLNAPVRTRGIRWALGVNGPTAEKPRVSFRGDENIAAMRAACRARMNAGVPADWADEQEMAET